MIESSGEEYQSCIYEKGTYLSPGKVGKTCWLVASALAVLPNQMKSGVGAIVTSPEHLHVVCLDKAAFDDVIDFLKSHGAPKGIGKIRIYNMQDDVDRINDGDEDYDMSFYNSVMVTNRKIRDRVASVGGRHAVIMSSLTGLSTAIERGVVGPPGSAGVKGKDGQVSGKGYSDPSKWGVFAHQMNKIRGAFQVDDFHMLWEAHIDVTKKFAMNRDDDGGSKESVAVSGKTGRNWGWNTNHTFRLVRNYGDQWEGTNVDKIYMNTRPDMEFFPGGRGQERLKKKEYCLSTVFKKLGLKRGGWGRKAEAKVKET